MKTMYKVTYITNEIRKGIECYIMADNYKEVHEILNKNLAKMNINVYKIIDVDIISYMY